jgi:death on curing protein
VSEPVWVDADLVIAAHDEGLALFGGSSGVRDQGLLQSALDRPRNRYAYGETDLAVLAAAVAFGIARNHPFVDGNKRAALSTIFMFCGLNGLEFSPDEVAGVVMIEGLADGRVSEDELAAWIKSSLV